MTNTGPRGERYTGCSLRSRSYTGYGLARILHHGGLRFHRLPRPLASAGVDRFEFDAELWLYDGDAAWHFITVPPAVSDDIEARATGPRRGFGAVRVRVTIGATSWSTSVFPDTKRRAYLLPVKKHVRQKEGIAAGDTVAVSLELLDD